MSTSKVGFGGGCHWCTEAVFLSVTGVMRVQQGWIASTGGNGSFSEAVIVHFDAQRVSLHKLIAMHLQTHSSTSAHSMRHKYRSAVYSFDDEQHRLAVEILQRLQVRFDQPLVTEVLPYTAFKTNQEKYHNYYYSNPDRPFCQNIIAEKVSIIRDQFPEYAKPVLDD